MGEREPTVIFDLTEGLARRATAFRGIRLTAYGLVAFGAVVTALGAVRLALNSAAGLANDGVPIAGGIVFMALGGVLLRKLQSGRVSGLGIGPAGVTLQSPNRRPRTVAWDDRNLVLDVYDLTRLPATNSWVLDDPVWRCGIRFFSPISVSFRIPREAYTTLLEFARQANLTPVPTGQPAEILDGEMFRLRHPR